jgi:hypothetical protein
MLPFLILIITLWLSMRTFLLEAHINVSGGKELEDGNSFPSSSGKENTA